MASKLFFKSASSDRTLFLVAIVGIQCPFSHLPTQVPTDNSVAKIRLSIYRQPQDGELIVRGSEKYRDTEGHWFRVSTLRLTTSKRATERPPRARILTSSYLSRYVLFLINIVTTPDHFYSFIVSWLAEQMPALTK